MNSQDKLRNILNQMKKTAYQKLSDTAKKCLEENFYH